MVTVDMIARDNTNYAENLGIRGSGMAAVSAKDEFISAVYVTRALVDSLAKEYEGEGRLEHAALAKMLSENGLLRQLNSGPEAVLMAAHEFFRQESCSGKWEPETMKDITMLLIGRSSRPAIFLLSSGDAKLNTEGRMLSRNIESINENVSTWFDMVKAQARRQ